MLSTVHFANDIRIVEKEAHTLAQANHSILLIARPPLAQQVNPNTHYEPLILPKMSRWLRPLVAGYQALKIIRIKKPTIIHFHDPEFIPVALLLKWRGFQIIYDVHEDTPADILSKQWIPKAIRPLFARVVGFLERYAARNFDGIVVATPTIGARFVQYGISPAIIKNYVKISEFSSLAEQPIKKQQAVYVGRISFDRGLREMANACKALNVPLILAGPAEPEVIQWLGEQQHIQWKGILGREAITSLLAESLVGLCVLHPEPNYLHALPIKLFEYMAASLPVIVSDLPSQREIVNQADCGIIVPSHDSNSLMKALQVLINNPTQATAMGKKGRDAVLQTFNWECEGKKLISLYETVLAKRKK